MWNSKCCDARQKSQEQKCREKKCSNPKSKKNKKGFICLILWRNNNAIKQGPDCRNKNTAGQPLLHPEPPLEAASKARTRPTFAPAPHHRRRRSGCHRGGRRRRRARRWRRRLLLRLLHHDLRPDRQADTDRVNHSTPFAGNKDLSGPRACPARSPAPPPSSSEQESIDRSPVRARG